MDQARVLQGFITNMEMSQQLNAQRMNQMNQMGGVPPQHQVNETSQPSNDGLIDVSDDDDSDSDSEYESDSDAETENNDDVSVGSKLEIEPQLIQLSEASDVKIIQLEGTNDLENSNIEIASLEELENLVDIDQDDDDMPPLIEITQNNLLHDFEQEEVDDDTASNDELKMNPVPHCYNLRVKASNNFDNFVRPTPRVGLSYSEEQKQKEEEEEEEQEEEDEGDGARFGDIINKDEESDEEEYEYNEEESDEEVVILEVEKKENEIINLIESDDEA